MAGGVTQYVLTGGPCDGNTGTLSPAIDQTGIIHCKGEVYKRDNPAKVVGGREEFKASGKVPKPPPPPKAPRAHSGWADLQRSANHHWPTTLTKAERLTRDALRTLNRARKVHG
jgi:hypothetical protein